MLTEKFAPPVALDPVLFEETTEGIPKLIGGTVLPNVFIRAEDGNVIPDDILVRFPKASRVAISDSQNALNAVVSSLAELQKTKAKEQLSFEQLCILGKFFTEISAVKTA